MFKWLLYIFACLTTSVFAMEKTKLRVATFNVSMEARNYQVVDIDAQGKKQSKAPQGNELQTALTSQHPQIKNIAQIIQKVQPDIILLNEFDHNNQSHENLRYFIQHYLNKSQQGEQPIDYPYFYQGPVNTGVKSGVDLNNNGTADETPNDTFGFGFFPGHYGMALLSKYPINFEQVRSFQLFKWRDMPNALKPMLPESNQSYYSDTAWQVLRLSSKSHWDIPITVQGKTLHILTSHPTPPVFDGPEDRNGRRNHDEIRFWLDYISDNQGDYIYDDNGNKGGLATKQPFIILGDLNASAVEGDAINTGIAQLISHPNINDPLPKSLGGSQHTNNNQHAKHHTAYWRMRADYVLPSSFGFSVKDSGVFWPTTENKDFALIQDRSASSDHRLVWVDVEL